ncbi:MAG: Sec-independent protein translocase protein TatB [Candidatus Nanopelagicales bacterium]
MFDIGIPEFVVIGVVALLVFGPDRLPQAAAQAGRFVRQLREAATAARAEVSAAAGLDSAELDATVNDLKSLHPRNLLREESRPPASQPGATQHPAAPLAAPQPAASDGPPQVDPDWI